MWPLLMGCPWGSGGEAEPRPPSPRPTASRRSRGQTLIARGGGRREVGQPLRSFEQRQAAVRIGVDANRRAHEVRSQRARRDLQGPPREAHAVVVADLSLLLHAHDLAPPLGRDRHERRASLVRCGREAGVVLGQEDRADEAVGRLDRGDASELELLRQPVLERAEGPFAATAGLGRVRRDVLDPELPQRPADLGRLGLRDPAAAFGGVEVVAAAVGV